MEKGKEEKQLNDKSGANKRDIILKKLNGFDFFYM
jgi:hypothetical protein